MTKRESGQDFDPKHRIVGAIVIVALAVILIPLILSDRDSSNGEPDTAPVATEEPSADGNKVAVTNLSPPAPTAEPSVSAPASGNTEEKTSTAKVEPKPKAPEPKPAPPHQAEAKTPSSGWVVQVGTFSNTANASRLEKKLRAQRQPVLTERVTVAGNAAVRLRVGPFSDRAAALKARERINKDVGVKGVVLAYP